MFRFDTLALDRQVRKAAGDWRRWRRRMAIGEGAGEDPLAAYWWSPNREESIRLAGRQAFQTIAELGDDDPLQKPLLRWVYRLAEQRINRAALVQQATLWRAAPELVDQPEYGRFTRRELLIRALREDSRRGGWLRAWASVSGPLAQVNAMLWERRREVGLGFCGSGSGLASADVIELPGTAVLDTASSWLDRTQGMLPELGLSGLATTLHTALAGGAAEGWPARLVPRALIDMLQPTGLLERVDVDPGELPELLAPASFLRGLRRLGASWVDATAPRHQPFVVAHDPYGLERRTMGAFFGLLPLVPSYAKRVMGLGGNRLSAHLRALARSLFLETRVAALRVVLRSAALSGERAFRTAYQEQVPRALGFDLPSDLAGVCFQLHDDDAQRLAGLFIAVKRQADLLQLHDDDWFRNPRATADIRGRADLSPEVDASAEMLASGMDATYRLLETGL